MNSFCPKVLTVICSAFYVHCISCMFDIVYLLSLDDFGFKHLLWVYSGRRGVHCWISDTIARQLDSHGRGAVIEYLSVRLKKNKKPT